jgi:predicted permease
VDALWIMLRNVLVFVALAIPGFILVKIKFLKAEQSGALSKLLMYVGMPFLVITSTVDKITFNKELIVMLLVTMLLTIVIMMAAFFVTKPVAKMETEQKKNGMMRFCTIFSNNGFLGIPLAIAVLSGNANAIMVLIAMNIITNVLMYTVGIYLISGDKNAISVKKALLNPVLIAFIVGVALNLLNVKEYIPEVGSYCTHFSNTVTPISMTILGMKMGGVNILSLFKSWKTYYVSAIKLIIFPIIAIAILFALRGIFQGSVINSSMILGAFISFSTPTAGLASTFSDNFDGDTEGAVAYTLSSTLLSVVTIPVLYWILCMIV